MQSCEYSKRHYTQSIDLSGSNVLQADLKIVAVEIDRYWTRGEEAGSRIRHLER